MKAQKGNKLAGNRRGGGGPHLKDRMIAESITFRKWEGRLVNQAHEIFVLELQKLEGLFAQMQIH